MKLQRVMVSPSSMSLWAVALSISSLVGGAAVIGAECEVSGTEDLLPAVVAPMAGEHPVWVVASGTPATGWCCSDCPVKALWIAARSHEGDLAIRGSRLDGTGRALLRSGGRGAAEELLIKDAHGARGVIPGGAERAVLRDYSFWPSHVFYPTPGCWEMIAHYGSSRIRIVQRLTDESGTSWCQERIKAWGEAGPN